MRPFFSGVIVALIMISGGALVIPWLYGLITAYWDWSDRIIEQWKETRRG